MRAFILLLFCLLIFNCEDKHSSHKNKISSLDSIVTNNDSTLKKTAIDTVPEFPKLNDDNVMTFLQDYGKKNKENKVRIFTDFGSIDILLFDETIYHRANFIYLIKQHYFDNTQFYRVVNNFIIQGGNSDDAEIADRRNHIGQYLLPPDTKRGFKHDRGVISMPSSEIENAYKLASPYEFFIVQQQGGSHHLDGEYTIFGKVTNGMDVVDKIATQETDDSDWPLHNVYIKKIEITN